MPGLCATHPDRRFLGRRLAGSSPALALPIRMSALALEVNPEAGTGNPQSAADLWAAM